MDRRAFISTAAASLLPLGQASGQPLGRGGQIAVRLDRPSGSFPHYWETCMGSDRASVALRSQWQADLALTHQVTGMRSVRFHGLFDDDMGVVTSLGPDGPITNFLYVDQIFDTMLQLGVRPFVELSFMPTAMASSQNTVFWYRGNASPPKRMEDWQALIAALARHLVDRYGVEEVAQWRFECWNEPNLNFWAGTQAQYFELYRRTAAALKSVDRRLQVGGPATAEMMWIPDFLADCAKHGTPVDFVSSHIYADDPQENVFGQANLYPYEEVMPRALKQARDQIRASAYPDAPLVISEWSSQDPAFIAQMVRDCAGLADTMSYWTFDNVFEEQGPIRGFTNDLYGLIGQRGVPRPSFQTFALLHRLGETRLEAGEGPVLATRRGDGSTAILAWHAVPRGRPDSLTGNPLVSPTGQHLGAGEALPLSLRLEGGQTTRVKVTTVDPARDPATLAYAAMGAPPYPTLVQINQLLDAAGRQTIREMAAAGGRIDLDLAPNSVVLIEVA